MPATLAQADDLIEQGRAHEAIELLEPLLKVHPREAELHYYIGYAHVEAGDIWEGLYGYERARELSGDPEYWGILTSLYMQVDLHIHAHRALRQAVKHINVAPLPGDPKGLLAAMDQELVSRAQSLGTNVKQAEEGLYLVECGRRALARHDYEACIRLNRQAIQLLGDWPPPHNNLSQALFYNGQPEEAIAEARFVLAREPENFHALSNAIRYLAWTGREDEARQLWQKAQRLPLTDVERRYKIVESAAILNDDEFIYRVLHPLARLRGGAWQKREPSRISEREQIFLAVAEANTGRRRDAQRRLESLQSKWKWVDVLLGALRAGKPGPGFSDRFPYFHSGEMLPHHEMERLVELFAHQDDWPEEQFHKTMEEFTARFPQIIRIAEKLIMEEDMAGPGMDILETIGTPEACAVLRRFALSQYGEDRLRMDALSRLARAGHIAQDEPLRVWLDGEWQEVYMKVQEIPAEEDEEEFDPDAAEALNEGIRAHQAGDYERAEQLFERALKLDPRIKQAYNNLAAMYSRRGEHEKAKELLHQALAIDPLYSIPRCNLALYLLEDNDVVGAEGMLEPLKDAPPYQPQDIALYSYTLARVLIAKEEYDDARRALRAALKAVPDYQLAKELLERLNQNITLLKGFRSLVERQRADNRRRRAIVQKKIRTPEPSLDEAMSIYPKDVLLSMGRAILPHGKWTGLRKAELVDAVIDALADFDALSNVVHRLSDGDRAALRQVLQAGGVMAWEEFAGQYGDDMDESGYWRWRPPETTMGRLRQRGLLVEATVAGKLLIVIPVELRAPLRQILA